MVSHCYSEAAPLIRFRRNPPSGELDVSKLSTFELILELQRLGWEQECRRASVQLAPYKHDDDSRKVWYFWKTISKHYLRALLQAERLKTLIYHFQPVQYYKCLLSVPLHMVSKVLPRQPLAFYKLLLKQGRGPARSVNIEIDQGIGMGVMTQRRRQQRQQQPQQGISEVAEARTPRDELQVEPEPPSSSDSELSQLEIDQEELSSEHEPDVKPGAAGRGKALVAQQPKVRRHRVSRATRSKLPAAQSSSMWDLGTLWVTSKICIVERRDAEPALYIKCPLHCTPLRSCSKQMQLSKGGRDIVERRLLHWLVQGKV